MEKPGTSADGAGETKDIGALEEQLADAQAEVERLQRSAANANARADHAIAEATMLRGDVLTATEASAAVAADAAQVRNEIETANEQSRAAAHRYRDLVLRTEPSLPADLIAGDSVEAIDLAVTAAREIVGRVRSHIESQAQAGRVPAGAPSRSAPDLSTLTPEQKIRHGLNARA